MIVIWKYILGPGFSFCLVDGMNSSTNLACDDCTWKYWLGWGLTFCLVDENEHFTNLSCLAFMSWSVIPLEGIIIDFL